MKPSLKKYLGNALLVAGIAGAVGWLVWKEWTPDGLGPAFASANGRVEARDIDVATKLALRVKKILVREGELVEPDEVLALMDTATLEAELAEAQAELRKTETQKATAERQVAQRKSEKIAAEAIVAQRQAELNIAERRLARAGALVKQNLSISASEYEDYQAGVVSGKAAVAATKADVAASEAAIAVAESQVVEMTAAIEAARANAARIQVDIEDSRLKSPRLGRVQYWVTRDGEMLPAGGVVLNMIDLMDVYMVFFLPTDEAGKVEIGQEVRLVLDALPHYVLPARATFVESVAQFTPKTVETANERAKLMFRIKAHIDPELLRKHLTQVKTGLPGMAYMKLDPKAEWPASLKITATP